ncbi:hypothetical protein AB6A40_009892 [Gnathostoma spinigerum]|uniref:Uncharacterized protein n=1 Tax=Gnathostoma spinigerum TaxID=75299 RepID=A0ABD6ETA0_9BILA
MFLTLHIVLPFVWIATIFDPSKAAHFLSVERPLNLSIQLCTLQRSAQTEDDIMFIFPDKVRYCVAIRTNKRVFDFEIDSERTINLKAFITVSWKQLGASTECSLQYKGYQGKYRLSPDLGYYSECQKDIAKYISQLATGDQNFQWQNSDEECPLSKLPRTFKDYLSCDFIDSQWYTLDFSSVIRYELFRKKTYHTYWSNHSTTFLIKPDRSLKKNGTEVDYLADLISLRIRKHKCDNVEYLMEVDKDWTIPLEYQIYYRIRRHLRIYFSVMLKNGTLEHWMTDSFGLIPTLETHELCVRISWDGYNIREQLCTVISVDRDCFTKTAAPLFTNSLLSFIGHFVILLLIR